MYVFMNEVNFPRRPEDTNEGMEKTFIHLFRKLSRNNQLETLGYIMGGLDSQTEDAAKANYLHLVKSPTYPPKLGSSIQSR